jgi:DNA mismatch endonuclease (patch repair protein)
VAGAEGAGVNSTGSLGDDATLSSSCVPRTQSGRQTPGKKEARQLSHVWGCRTAISARFRYLCPVADSLSKAERSERMSRVRNRDTKPELVVRGMIHRLGFRYRLHDRRLPGSPDIIFRSRRKAIFVHGCFWHRHPDESCRLARMPKSQLDFWRPKLEGNRDRDLRIQSELDAIGWTYIVVWECELRHREQLENKLLAFLTKGDAL